MAPPPTMPMPVIKDDVTTLKGGLDQLTPTLALGPGLCREAVNFECAATGGYARVGGYERYDGRPSPSGGVYAIVQISSFVNTPTVGQTLTGATSTATGTILELGDNYLVLLPLTGTFVDGEIVSVGVTMIGLTVSLTVSLSIQLQAQYLNLAADALRANIQPVPGSGPIRGIVSHFLAGVYNIYAFRDNAGGTACNMFRATSSSWSQMTLFNEVAFSAGGPSIPADGDTLTQGGNTAIVKRVVLESGTWASSTAAGRLIVTTPSPGNFAAGAATVGAVPVTLGGAQTAITLAPGGQYEFDLGNFAGQLTTRRIYGADGVNRCFEWDGLVFVPIRTGAAVDTPKHIRVHHNHLIVSIGSSIMGSGIGTPYNWTALAGAFEKATGDTITNMLVQPGNQDNATLAIWGRNSTGMLYGTSTSDFKYVAYATASGGIDYMAQNLDQSYVLDDRGVVALRTAQEFGNFADATLTRNIQRFIEEKRSMAVASCINKDKSQYRAFFSDGSALYVTLVNGKLIGSMPQLFAHPFSCVWNGEHTNGSDISFAGAAEDGYVYQLDIGSSFDGEPIDASITLNWNFLKSPRWEKRFHGASIEVQGLSYSLIQVGYLLGYNSEEIPQPTPADYQSDIGGSGHWDDAFWDAFSWDGRTLSPTEVPLDGRAENIQFTLASSSDYIYPYTVNSLILSFSMGRRVRR